MLAHISDDSVRLVLGKPFCLLRLHQWLVETNELYIFYIMHACADSTRLKANGWGIGPTDRQTDRRTDGQTERKKHTFCKAGVLQLYQNIVLKRSMA